MQRLLYDEHRIICRRPEDMIYFDGAVDAMVRAIAQNWKHIEEAAFRAPDRDTQTCRSIYIRKNLQAETAQLDLLLERAYRWMRNKPMAYSDETRAQMREWNARKLAQWERIKEKIPGLQLVRSSEQMSQWMVVISADDFYESVVFGQLPQLVMERTGPSRTPKLVDAPDKKKPHTHRSIDLDDHQLDLLLERWAQRRTALYLPFVPVVWRADGKEYVRED